MSQTGFGKRIILNILTTLPYTGAIAREWDSIESNKRFKEIEQEITKIWDFIDKNPQSHLEGFILNIMQLIENKKLVTHFNFRRAKSCMVFLKEINSKSELGQSNDPTIKYEECIDIVKNYISDEATEKELELVTYELEKENLIYKHASVNSPLGFHAIGPKEYFFCKTDSIFQEWDPQYDAKEIVTHLINNDNDSISIQELEDRFNWEPRRINAAIAFLHLNELIHHNYELGGIKHVLPWIRLSEEAHFFLEYDK